MDCFVTAILITQLLAEVPLDRTNFILFWHYEMGNVIEILKVWSFFLLLVPTIHFMVQTIESYSMSRTNMAQSFEPITKLPTLVICHNSRYLLEYGIHLNISYHCEGQ